MFNILVFVAFFALAGAFSLGFKAANMLRERRKSRAFQYLRDAGAYPPIYTGYGQQQQQQQQPQPDTQTRNSGATVDQILYVCIVLSMAYACWCGLT